jgi:hypothetical protein
MQLLHEFYVALFAELARLWVDPVKLNTGINPARLCYEFSTWTHETIWNACSLEEAVYKLRKGSYINKIAETIGLFSKYGPFSGHLHLDIRFIVAFRYL